MLCKGYPNFNIVKIKFIFLSLFFFQNVFAQMTIDLGNDTVFCAGDTNLLGTNLVVSGGQPPYIYEWFTEPYSLWFANFTIYTSDYLNDTTIANPILSSDRDTTVFFLTVYDSLGQSATDSITVYISYFIGHLVYLNVSMVSGDTAYFNFGSSTSGGIGELSYLWRPNHGLIDSTSISFYAAPQHSINYYPIITDSAGCTITAGTYYYVYVGYLGINELLKAENSINIYPNPSTGTIFIKDEEKLTLKAQIFDATGRFMVEVLPQNFPNDMSHFAKGTYYLQIETEEGIEKRTVVLE